MTTSFHSASSGIYHEAYQEAKIRKQKQLTIKPNNNQKIIEQKAKHQNI